MSIQSTWKYSLDFYGPPTRADNAMLSGKDVVEKFGYFSVDSVRD